MDNNGSGKHFEHKDRRNFADRKPGDRKFGDRKPGEGRPGERRFGDRKPGEGRPGERRFGDRKPGEGRPGERKFGDRKPGEGRPGDRRFGDRKPGEGRTGDRKFANRKPGEHGGHAGGARRGAPRSERGNYRPREKGPSARDVALNAFRDVLRNNAFASQAIDRALKDANLADNDRRLAAGIFYFTLENRLRIEHILMQFMKLRPEPEAMEILEIAAAQLLFMDKIPDHACVNEAVEQVRKAKKDSLTGIVNAVLHNVIRARDAGELTLPDAETAPVEYISEKYSVSLWLAQSLVDAYGAETAEKIVAWTPDRRTDTVRANRTRITDAELEEYLTKHEIEWKHGLVEGAYNVTGAGRLAELDGYRNGLFSIQGESSMLAARAVCVKPAMRVLDACAAPGGKTALMAEAMQGSGRVFAWDLHEHRVELIRAAANRLGLDNVRPQEYDASHFNPTIEYSMNAVLVDAPCTGVGVMGAKPDIRYRLTQETKDALLPIQKSILETCARYVDVGGILVYSTCTILPEENEQQIRAFMEAHPEFEPATDDAFLPESLRPLYKDGMIQILPGRDGIEGFFIARMRRKAVGNV